AALRTAPANAAPECLPDVRHRRRRTDAQTGVIPSPIVTPASRRPDGRRLGALGGGGGTPPVRWGGRPRYYRAAMWRPHVFAAALFAALAVAMTWPLTANLGSAVAWPGDPFINAWILDWDRWATFHQPLSLFNANV